MEHLKESSQRVMDSGSKQSPDTTVTQYMHKYRKEGASFQANALVFQGPYLRSIFVSWDHIGLHTEFITYI